MASKTSRKEKYYHMKITVFSFGKGDVLEQKVAYRVGIEYTDDETEKTYNYKRKKIQEKIETLMVLPREAQGKKFEHPLLFADAVKKKERATRKDAQFFREFEFTMYRELSKEENIELASRFAQKLAERGMCCMLNFHKLGMSNPHCHLLASMRELDETGEGFGKKKTEWNKKEMLLQFRKEYEEVTNTYFKEKGLDLFVSSDSYETRKIDREAQKHIPMNSQGIDKVEAVKKENLAIKKRNRERELLEKTTQEKQEATRQLDNKMLLRELEHDLHVDKVLTKQEKERIVSLDSVKPVSTNKASDAHLVSLDNLVIHSKKETVKTNDTQLKKGIKLEELIHTFSKKTLSKNTSSYLRYPNKLRKEVLGMAERKLGPQRGENALESMENDIKQISTTTVKKTAGLAMKITEDVSKSFLRDIKKHRRINRIANKDYNNKKKIRQASYNNFKEKRSFYENNLDSRKGRIRELKHENKHLKNSIKQTKKFSISGYKQRKEMKQRILENKERIQAQKLGIAREKSYAKSAKRDLRRSRFDELKSKLTRVKTEIRELTSERRAAKFAGIQQEQNGRIVSKKERAEQVKLNVQKDELEKFNSINKVDKKHETTIDNVKEFKKKDKTKETEQPAKTMSKKDEKTKENKKENSITKDNKKENSVNKDKKNSIDKKIQKAMNATGKIKIGNDALAIIKQNKIEQERKNNRSISL